MTEIETLLKSLDTHQLKYVSWKNNHELEDCFRGDSDLDIFIDPSRSREFTEISASLGWVALYNPVARFRRIKHFYCIDAEGVQFHIHAYLGFITGESWLKEYEFDFATFLFNHRMRHKSLPLWVLTDRAQSYIFLLRHLLKNSSVISRILYSHDIDSYAEEWAKCSVPVRDLIGFGPISIDKYLNSIASIDELLPPSLMDSIAFRYQCRRNLRYPSYLLPLLRLWSLSVRVINKLFYRRKKLFYGEGLIVVVAGMDGAGKSSMVERLGKKVGEFLTVTTLSLGKPQGKIVEALRALVSRKKNTGNREKLEPSSSVTVKSAMRAVLLGALRLRAARKAVRAVKRGELVLVDRWPSEITGVMDSPKLLNSTNSGSVYRFLSKLESRLYDAIPKADICVYLQISVERALIRNALREKPGKETDDELRDRHRHNKNVFPKAKRLLEFDNEGEFENKFRELQRLVWLEISNRRSRLGT